MPNKNIEPPPLWLNTLGFTPVTLYHNLKSQVQATLQSQPVPLYKKAERRCFSDTSFQER